MVASQSLRELVMILTALWGSDPHPFGRSALWETHKDIGANLAKKEQPSEITQIGNPWSGHWINCCETILAYLDNLKPIKTRLHSSASIRQEDHDHNHQRLEKAKRSKFAKSAEPAFLPMVLSGACHNNSLWAEAPSSRPPQPLMVEFCF